MTVVERMRRSARALMNEGSPWGGSGGSDGGSEGGGRGGGGNGPRNPWARPSGEPPQGGESRGPSVLDGLLARARAGFGGGLPTGGPGRAVWAYLALGVLFVWIATTCIHRIGPQERGIVTQFGSFNRTLPPGVGLTLPAPIESVRTIDVEEIRTIDIGSTADTEKLVLTGDRNIIDLSYSVRWNIRSPELYVFQIDDPDQTIQEVAESAMRAEIANTTLAEALGAGRGMIEDRVRTRMQAILDGYQSGVQIQGVAIKQADPPDAVNDAFKDVSAAQQTAQTYMNEARAYAEQLNAKAQGDAQAFDKVYDQYKLAPDVTRRRMYYETMENVLAGVDKTIVDAPGVNPYLSLPEIKRAAPRAPGNDAAATGDQQ
jgi:membrane protease subunit HflK